MDLSGGGGNRDGENRVLLRWGDALEGADVGKLRVLNDDADCLCGIHGRTAADRDDAVGLGLFESLDAVLDIFDGGIGLDIGVNAVSEACGVKQICNLLCDAELDEGGVRGDESLPIAALGELGHDVFNSSAAMVGDGVQDNAVCHFWIPPVMILFG